MTVKSDEYRRLLAGFASGVTVISAWRIPGEPDVVTVSAFSALSLAPPLVLACIGVESDCYELLKGVDHFGVSILHERQGELALACAELGASKREALSRFGELWDTDQAMAPLLRDCTARLTCRRERSIEQGDHVIIVGAVLSGDTVSARAPLVYVQGGFRELA